MKLNDQINHQNAILTQKGKTLQVQILSPSGATFTERDAVPLQADNEDWQKLAIHLTDITDLKIQVKLIPIKK